MSMGTITYALLGGILPALVWLIFWLREDYKNPEPRGLILKMFLLGMLAVIVVLPLQKGADKLLPGMTFTTILVWVFLEEILKFGMAYFSGIKSVEDNEPIDPIIYMITVALGFAALENALFIFGPLVGEEVTRGVITGNLRFIGASLLHVVSSGIIGVALSLTFYKPKWIREIYVFLGLVVAIIFHTLFNISIIKWGNSGAALSFIMVWLGVISLLILFEKAKTIARENKTEYN